MDISNLYHLFLESTGIATDSRKVTEGKIFFALKGEHFNGNDYAAKVLEQGASYAIIDEEDKKISGQCIVVNDVLETLQQLANYHRKQFDIPVLAITGSNGKTTTKELVNEVLATTYKVHYTLGNFNNHIGVPLTLLAMPRDTEIAVIEMGANHPKEIDFLSNIAEPNFGLVTNVGRAHLEGFGGFEGVIKTKGELYDYLGNNKGTALVNLEEDHLSKMASLCEERIDYESSEEEGGTLFRQASPFLSISYQHKGKTELIQTQLIGAYNFPNILTAITIGKHFNVDFINIKKALESYTPTNNRSQLIKKGSNVIILDAYNANPTSMKAALSNFKQMEAGNKIVVIGDMLELGNESEQEHRGILESIQDSGFSQIITVGKEFGKVNAIHSYETIEELKSQWNWNSLEKSTILIKGSRGIKLEKLLLE